MLLSLGRAHYAPHNDPVFCGHWGLGPSIPLLRLSRPCQVTSAFPCSSIYGGCLESKAVSDSVTWLGPDALPGSEWAGAGVQGKKVASSLGWSPSTA